MKILRVYVVFAAISVLALTGCSPAPAPESHPTRDAPTKAPLPAVAAPAQVFGGDCSAMFDVATLSNVLAQDLVETTYDGPVDPEYLLVEQAGGIHCSWGQPDNSPALYVVAVPGTAVTLPEQTGCVATMLSENSCAVDVTANGIRISGIVAAAGGDPGAVARADKIEAFFIDAANAAAPAPALVPLPGAWHNHTDCAAIAESLDWAALGAAGPLMADESMGTDVYVPPAETELRGGHALSWCSLYSSHGGGPTFWALGGGGWARDAVLRQEGATIADAPGLDLVIESGTESTTIDIFDGVNWLRTSADASDTPFATATAIVAALDAAAIG